MKVLLLVASFPPEVRSQSNLMYQLATDLVRSGHEVRVVTGIPRYNLPEGGINGYGGKLFTRERLEGIQILRLPVLPVPRRMPLMRGAEHLVIALQYAVGGSIGGKPDVTLVYSPPLPLGLSAYSVKKRYGAPFVFNVQDLYPQTAIDMGLLRSRALIRLAEGMERFIYQRASTITVHSEGNRDGLVARGVPEEKVQVVPNWVDTEEIRLGERLNGFRKRYGLGDKFVVSFAGVMGYAQGLGTVLEAASSLRDYQDTVFLMVGDGSFKDPLVQQAKDSGLSNMMFLPMQPQEEYPQILAASDVSLVSLDSSVKTPVVPAKLLSIMASGRPVVASVPAGGDTLRIIDAAGCGLSSPPGDAEALAQSILHLYQHPEVRVELGRKGRAYAEAHYSRKACVAQYVAVLEQAIADKAGVA